MRTILRRAWAALRCCATGHPVEPFRRSGRVVLLRCRRCGLGGLRHEVETPPGRWLPVGEERLHAIDEELRWWEDLLRRAEAVRT